MYYTAGKSYTQDKGKYKKIKQVIIITGLILVTITLLAFNSYSRKPVEYNKIVIKDGDTLWAIVKKINIHNEDPRKIINQIKKINNMDNVVLQPGQTIKIPQY